MLKRWLTGWELQDRWKITQADLADMILSGELAAFESATHTPLNVQNEKDYILYLHENPNAPERALIPTLIERAFELSFRVSDVAEFEKLNGIAPHETARGRAGQMMGTTFRKPETPAPSDNVNNQTLRAAMKKIGYSDFIRIFRIDKPQDWNPGLEINLDGVFVRNPKEYYDEVFLGSAEIAALTEHPTGNLRESALAFPCSIKELAKFIVFHGLKGYCSRGELRTLKEKCDDPHSKKPETQTDVPLQIQTAGPVPAVLEDGNTIVRKAQAMAIAKMVRQNFPNLTIKDAAMEINARIAAVEAFDKYGHPLTQGYSVKHLIRIIKPLGFKSGKPGRISKK